VQNGTAFPLLYRQAVPRAGWLALQPYTAEGFAKPYLLDAPATDLELRSVEPQADGTFSCEVVSLDPSAAASGPERARGDLPALLRLGGGRGVECLAHSVELMEALLSPSGLARLPGAGGSSLGGTRLDRALRIVPKPPMMTAAHLAAAARLATPGAGGAGGGLQLAVSFAAVDVSLVDHTPQELLLLSADDVSVEYRAGVSAGVPYLQLSVRVSSAQLDDQLYGTAYPVAARPADGTAERPAGREPLLTANYTSQPGRRTHVLHCPCIAARLAPLRVCLNEPLLWRLYALMQALSASAAAGWRPRWPPRTSPSPSTSSTSTTSPSGSPSRRTSRRARAAPPACWPWASSSRPWRTCRWTSPASSWSASRWRAPCCGPGCCAACRTRRARALCSLITNGAASLTVGAAVFARRAQRIILLLLPLAADPPSPRSFQLRARRL